MSFVKIRDCIIFCNQIKLIEEVESYQTRSLQITFIDGTTRFIYNASINDVKINSGKYYEAKN